MLELKTVVPGQFSVSAQPTPQDVDLLAQQGFKTIINNRPDSEAQGQPSAPEVQAAAQTHGIAYIHLPVTVDTISKSDVEAFAQAVNSAELPVVAHCGTGKRAYLLWAAGEVLYKGRGSADLIDQASGIGIDAKELQHLVKHVSDEQ